MSEALSIAITAAKNLIGSPLNEGNAFNDVVMYARSLACPEPMSDWYQ